MQKPLWWFVFAALPVTALCLGIYIAGQQIYRQTANDPQIQLAEDGVAVLNAGGVPAELVNRNEPLIDIGTSLKPWVAVYDSAGQGLESSAQLDGAPPKLPEGVLSTDKTQNYDLSALGQEKITWQPRAGVRQALVISVAKGGRFVVAGRSLRLSEERTGQLGVNMLIGWLVTLAGVLCLSLGGWRLLKR